ncbi:MBL fold metallo-hydrolase [Clostridium gasigenes]|uniref:MBL fold metallo-hydrolase n=1 Tax=Clostridium gasigenes TaxID=94869 RepID=A0A7X0R5A0_9CLOT|nr:MBL fold metallo-hydrolase [Clostridium gasigenes]MBB6621922.1 MBL fold metallo-hydrolase [Clostridium gasigenes]MBB6716114.1 MBL fold metallo-hydrolase [Clostridium gasigenes]MBU3106478.1 MBL fold metallo-hydrolase [Clostridium gasigenes]MBU3134882.1 MBL fold metallo-hydrolase [Clostridium gasigenes]
MIIKVIPAGPLQTNCYIVMDEKVKEAIVLDPGQDPDLIIREIESLNCKVSAILLTHAHADHDDGVVDVKNKYNVPVYMNREEEKYMDLDSSVYGKLPKIYDFIEDGDILKVGDLDIKCIHTPGHTKGGMCFLIEDKVFTGDTLFQGSIGRTDFIGGDFDEIIKSINEKLLILENNVEVYPGHGPKSTIIFERMRNPFLA